MGDPRNMYVVVHSNRGYYDKVFTPLGIFESHEDALASRHKNKKAIGKPQKAFIPSPDNPEIYILTTVQEYQMSNNAGCCTVKIVPVFDTPQAFPKSGI